ncbi:MAG: hypothetical protein ACFFC7_25885, partial [Candidatus Hermodarchaeota archaeon]
ILSLGTAADKGMLGFFASELKTMVFKVGTSLQVDILSWIDKIIKNRMKAKTSKIVRVFFSSFFPKTYKYREMYQTVKQWAPSVPSPTVGEDDYDRYYEAELCRYLGTNRIKHEYIPNQSIITEIESITIHLRIKYDPPDDRLLTVISRLIEVVHLPRRETPRERALIVIIKQGGTADRGNSSVLFRELSMYFMVNQVEYIELTAK